MLVFNLIIDRRKVVGDLYGLFFSIRAPTDKSQQSKWFDDRFSHHFDLFPDRAGWLVPFGGGPTDRRRRYAALIIGTGDKHISTSHQVLLSSFDASSISSS